MKLIRGNSFYFPAPVTIGGFMIEKELILFDTGNDDSSVRKAYRELDGVKIIAVLNTHSHADHCGGNSYIKRQFEAIVYAPELETSFIEQPILEPTYLYGASPVRELQNKFLLAKPSIVDHVIKSEERLEIMIGNRGYTFQPISLKGHAPNQYGYLTEDHIAYLGDALISSEMVAKHPLIFTYDVTDHYASLEKLKTLKADGYVIAHGGYYESIDLLISDNKNALDRTQDIILSSLSKGGLSFDGLHQILFDSYGMTENLSQNLLNRSVIRAHVKHLVDRGDVSLSVHKGCIMLLKST
ncbi:MAG TPA: hypothetical protein DCS67_10680 [Clostridiales bacterium UBA8960]|jgi:glyoxylase-like metal-dependent hydrolase (beta-lactamase superfamily II)|nr:hypothetical protein [Clostridiales bacterium UBA8960]